MARPPKPIDPDQSALHWLGHELRRWRTQRGLSQKTLGGLIGFSRVYISLVETAQERPAQPFVERCDHALETGGRLLAIYEHVTAEARWKKQTTPRQGRLPQGCHGRVGQTECRCSMPSAGRPQRCHQDLERRFSQRSQ